MRRKRLRTQRSSDPVSHIKISSSIVRIPRQLRLSSLTRFPQNGCAHNVQTIVFITRIRRYPRTIGIYFRVTSRFLHQSTRKSLMSRRFKSFSRVPAAALATCAKSPAFCTIRACASRNAEGSYLRRHARRPEQPQSGQRLLAKSSITPHWARGFQLGYDGTFEPSALSPVNAVNALP